MTNAFTAGFDGWIYACHGFANSSTVQGSDGRPVTMESGNIYRFRPDGSHAEYVSHGQVNPFGLAFDALGRLYSCDCHSRPIYQNLRGAYYPSFGRADDGLGFGPAMIKHDHGSTGIGGIAVAENDHFPPEYRGSIFLGNVVTGRVHRDAIRWVGSSPRAEEQPDLVSSDDPWFRPVDLEFGPDGALYIADFYNRIIGHYEVPLDHPGRDRERGRIWRVVYRGPDGTNPPPVDPRPAAATATVDALVADLEHPNLVVRGRAADLLVGRGLVVAARVRAALERPAAPQAVVQALWVLHRLGALDADRLVAAVRDDDEAVRVHAARIWGDRPLLGEAGLASLAVGLQDPSPHVRRAAAEAWGLHPGPRAIRALLDLLAATPGEDDHLRHVARIALRDSLRDDRAWDRITLTPGDEAALADVALGLPSARSAAFLLGYLAEHPDGLGRRAAMLRHVARYGEGDPQPGLVKLARTRRDDPAGAAGDLKAIAEGTQERNRPLAAETRAWGDELAGAWLGARDPGLVDRGIDLATALDMAGASDRLAAVAADRALPAATRASAAAAHARFDPAGAVPALGARLLDAGEPAEIRAGAAKLLGASGRDDARAALIGAMKLVPAGLQTTIAAALAATAPGASALLDAVVSGQASPRPLGERAVVARLEASGVPDLKSRLAGLLKDIPPADGRIVALIDDRRADYRRDPGDPARGASVFARNCAACHQVGGVGARVGPQLDGIGGRGLDRLAEDILDPNRNVDQAFRVTTLALLDGRTLAGLVLRQDGEMIVLADAEGKEVRVPASAVEDRRVAQLSPMPANFADVLPPADFRDLMAYLLAGRAGPAPAPR